MDPTITVAIIGGVFALLTGVAVEFLRRQHNVVREVRNQVQNSHSTNLRDDIDLVLHAVQRVERAQDNFHNDLRVEREERLVLERRVDRFEAAR